MRCKSLSDEIREAVRKSGRTSYDIARKMNVATSTVWRFAEGKSGLSLALLDRLADVLDLHVTIGQIRKGK
jgi:transcriptional regulator with XRE-family HTH domain